MRVVVFLLSIAFMLTSCHDTDDKETQSRQLVVPTAYTYADFSLMDEIATGQYVAGDRSGWTGQWAWQPQRDGSSRIRWGATSEPLPVEYEQFSRSPDGLWVLLDGYGSDAGIGVFAQQIVTREQMGDAFCRNMQPIPSDVTSNGKQHYVKWDVNPSSSYCLEAWGYIDWAGQRIDFYHKQIWRAPTKPGACVNRFMTGQTCIGQYEVWKDNNCFQYGGKCGGPLITRHDRENTFALDKGPAFRVQNFGGNNPGWRADMVRSTYG